jgi:hypothetical protein
VWMETNLVTQAELKRLVGMRVKRSGGGWCWQTLLLAVNGCTPTGDCPLSGATRLQCSDCHSAVAVLTQTTAATRCAVFLCNVCCFVQVPEVCSSGLALSENHVIKVDFDTLLKSPECSLRVTLAPEVPLER